MMFDDYPKFNFLRFMRDLMIALIVVGLWAFCCMQCRAQTVPLVRVAHDSFTSYYDLQTHCPALVVYQLEARHFSGSYKIAGRHFKMDTQLPRPRVKDGDFSGTGYVRGHLCSAGDRDSDKAWLKETYLTSNLVPMTMVCNSGAFKAVEDSCRRAALAGHRLLIARGPIHEFCDTISAATIGSRVTIRVPAAIFSFAKCLDCGYRYVTAVRNTHFQESCITYQVKYDERVAILLTNIMGLWSREEYETITR